MVMRGSRSYRFASCTIGVLMAVPVNATWAQAPKSGEAVYKETCAACHATGVSKSPPFGDKKAWAPLIKEGQVTLTVDGWFGVRGMPPRGGNNSLTLEEFARGVVHMASAAGANWKDPDAKMLERMHAAEKRKLDKAKAKK